MIPNQLQKKGVRFILLGKKSKVPLEENWQKKNNYPDDDAELQKHLEWGGNYGVLCGSGLIVMDADTKQFNDIIKENFPKTFAVKTKNGTHYYYFCVGFDRKRVLKKEHKHLGEIQSSGSFVVGANCIHPSGQEYKVVDDIEISEIDGNEIDKVLKEFYASEGIKKNIILEGAQEGLRNDTMFRLACGFREKDLTKEETYIVLKGINEKNKPPLSDNELKSIIQSAYGYKVETKIEGEATLQDVYDVYKKWLHIEDTDRIDAVLSIAITREVLGTKLWLIVIGPSGDGKSEQLNALNNCRFIKTIQEFTAKTLVNGNPKTPDFAPTIKNHTIIISDMAQILKLHPNEKAQVWAQLRNLYDGFAGKQSGLGKDVLYTDLNVTLLAGSTPVIDAQILIHQDLGTRELVYRTKPCDIKPLMEKIFMNEKQEKQMRIEISEVTQKFMETKKYVDVDVPPSIGDKLKDYAEYLTIMRASVQIDSYSGELIQNAHPERPTRILKQFIRLYKALKSLDPNYTDEKALSVIKHIKDSSSFPNRVNVLYLMIEETRLSTYKIAEKLKIGIKTAYRELNVLWNMGLLKRETERDNYGKEHHHWTVRWDNSLIKKIKDIEEHVG